LSESTKRIVNWRCARGAAQGTSRVPEGRPDSARDSSTNTNTANSCAHSSSQYFANQRLPEFGTGPPSQAACRTTSDEKPRFSLRRPAARCVLDAGRAQLVWQPRYSDATRAHLEAG